MHKLVAHVPCMITADYMFTRPLLIFHQSFLVVLTSTHLHLSPSLSLSLFLYLSLSPSLSLSLSVFSLLLFEIPVHDHESGSQ